MNIKLKTLGDNIRLIRKQQRLTQIDLAIIVGIDRSYLSEIENGRANASICLLYAITDALKIPIIQIFDEK